MAVGGRAWSFAARWLPVVAHGAIYICAVLIALVWLSITFFLDNERASAERSAVRNAMNLAGAFEEHLSRSITDIDRSLKIVRAQYTSDPASFDLIDWPAAAGLFKEEVLQVSIIGPDGRMRLSNIDPTRFEGLDLSDREHFQVQLRSETDSLFVSKPVIGRTTGKPSIQLARRIEGDDGSFAGTIVASLDPAYLTRIYNAVNTGVEGYIRVIGLDGIVRATSGSSPELIGRDVSGGELFERFPAQSSGWYYTRSRFSDGVPRLLVYRAVSGYPLVVAIGQSSQEIFGHLEAKQRVGHFVATILTLLIFGITVITVRANLAAERDQSELERANMLLNTTLANIPHGVCLYGPDKKLLIANRLYSTMYGLDPDIAKPGTSLQEILDARVAAGSSPANTERYVASRLQEAFLPAPACMIDELQDGRVFAIARQSMPDGGSLAIHQDITAQKRNEERISHLAHFDGLTNLANRLRFLEHVDKAAERYQVAGDRFAIHLLDLDRFKEVNDSLGHAVGDSLLMEVAARLRACIGPQDVVARLGGDEFTVLQALGSGGASDAGALAAEVLKVVSRPFEIEGHHLTIETSIGLVLAPDHGLKADELLKKADLALYRAKSDGRNDWRMFERDMEQEARARLALAMDLRESIARGEFELYYQPVVTVAGEIATGAEALLRWRSPARGLVSPGDFIPLAEDTGLIIPLGEWVLRRACEDAAAWPEHLRVAVNLSAVQIRSGRLAELVKRTLAETGLAANRLELEVTESVLLQHNDDNLRVLSELQSLGIAIVLDDFGTGYSSMSYLLRFPFDKIKIDRSFVAEMPRRDDCAAIVNAATGLARSLGIDVTAEGVETAEQLALLRTVGCTLAQGYLFGRPCPKSELVFDQRRDFPVSMAAAS
jgi:diguanylate cyclase (GGDEF)-like protein